MSTEESFYRHVNLALSEGIGGLGSGFAGLIDSGGVVLLVLMGNSHTSGTAFLFWTGESELIFSLRDFLALIIS